MLLPRYSLRTTVYGLTGCAVLFFIVGQAFRGQGWAVVISVAVVCIFATLTFHGLFFLLTCFLSRFVGSGQLPAHTSRGGVQATADQLLQPSSQQTFHDV